jgi:hypothetical protein
VAAGMICGIQKDSKHSSKKTELLVKKPMKNIKNLQDLSKLVHKEAKPVVLTSGSRNSIFLNGKQ